MNSKKFNEEKYLRKMDNIRKSQELHKFEKEKIQKCKFELISELVNDLFKHKNCRDCFINISNLIILFLTVFEKDSPFDIYSEYEEENSIEKDDEYKQILKRENR